MDFLKAIEIGLKQSSITNPTWIHSQFFQGKFKVVIADFASGHECVWIDAETGQIEPCPPDDETDNEEAEDFRYDYR